MSKRKFDEVLNDENDESDEKRSAPVKNSLDSEEEDDEVNEDNYNILPEDDIEGTEEGPLSSEATVGFTAFNLNEELEEGHFDKDGHYLWKKEKEIRDNWLDNIDFIQVKSKKGDNGDKESEERGLADSDSDSEDERNIMFDPKELYQKILTIVRPGETISKALSRLGKSRAKISSAERWKRKKAGLSETDENSETITQLTSVANELLARTGNVDVYDESYETMARKIGREVISPIQL